MAHQTAEAGGLDVAGPEDAPTAVFLHGAMFTRKLWAPQRDLLADEFRVLAPDLPGHGDRAGRDFDFERALSVVDETVEATGDDPVLLVGLSLGGYVATTYASQHPDDVAGLVVSGASANPVGRMETVTRAIGKASRLATKSERVCRTIENRAAKWVNERDLSREHKREIVESGFYPRQFGIAGKYLAGTDFRRQFAAYPGPALVLNGERDAVMRRGEDDHAAAATDARVETVDGVGHVCTLHRATRYTDAVRRFYRRSVASGERVS
ncbi:MAG: alpha/beta fold hydrolase [Thiohalospira sp.]